MDAIWSHVFIIVIMILLLWAHLTTLVVIRGKITLVNPSNFDGNVFYSSALLPDNHERIIIAINLRSDHLIVCVEKFATWHTSWIILHHPWGKMSKVQLLWKTLVLRQLQVLCGEVSGVTMFTTDPAVVIVTKKGSNEYSLSAIKPSKKRWLNLPHFTIRRGL